MGGNWDNVFRLWTVFFCLVAGVGINIFYAPLFGKKTLAVEDYLLREGAALTFIGLGSWKLCLAFGWESDWQHLVLALTTLCAAVGITILLIKYRHSKGTAALQEYMYKRKSGGRASP